MHQRPPGRPTVLDCLLATTNGGLHRPLDRVDQVNRLIASFHELIADSHAAQKKIRKSILVEIGHDDVSNLWRVVAVLQG
jgi:hypothetical protein